MKNIISLLFSLNCLVFSQDKLLFNQGEQWEGKVSSVTDKIIKVKSSLSKQDLQFKLDNLKAIEFSDTKALKGTHRITLINGDGLTGDLEELNKEFLVLKTLCSGILQVPRKYVSIIETVGNSELIVGGISNKDGWNGTIDADGSFKGPIYRDIDSTKSFVITAEIYLSDAYSFYMNLNNKSKQHNKRFYLYTKISSSSRRILIVNGQRQVNNLGALRVASTVANGTEHVTLGNASLEENTQLLKLKMFFNPQENFVAANVNNIEIGKAKLNSKFDFDEMILSLRSDGGKAYLKSFKIEKWNGTYTSYLIADKDEKHDNILLKNGDIAFGQVASIKEKNLAFSSKLGEHKLNMELISSITLLNTKSETVKKNHLLRLENGQKITGNLQKIEDGFVYIKNDIFPNLKIKQEYCRSLSNLTFEKSRSRNLQTMTHFGNNKVFGEIKFLKNKKLKINNINLVGELTFDIDKVSNIDFTNKFKIEDADWLLELVNGDSIPCKVTSMNSEDFLVSSNSGEFKIKTENVNRLFKRMIKPRTNSRSRGVSFSNSKSIKNVKLPSKSEINFTVERMPSNDRNSGFSSSIFQMRLLGDKNSTRNSYYVQIGATPIIYFRGHIQPKEHKKVEFKKINDVSFKIDKEKALFEIWINGVHTHTFADPEGFQAKGDGVLIYNNSKYKVSKLRFNEWNGDKLDTDKFLIADDWKAHKGIVTSIEKDVVTIGEKTFPLNGVREVSLGNAIKRENKAPYTMRLVNLATFKVDSFSIEGDKITVQHPLIGEITVDKKNVSEIKSN